MYELKKSSASTHLKVTKLPIGAKIKLAQLRLHYIEKEGKMTNSPSASPKAHFSSLIAEYKKERGNCSKCLNDLEIAQNNLKAYEEKSFSEKARHPIKNFIKREHQRLKREVKARAKALDNAKIQLKVKENAIKNESIVIKNQAKRISNFKRAEKMYAKFKDPNNQKYITMFGNDKTKIDMWMNSLSQNYNNSTFGVTNNNGTPKYNEISDPSGQEFKMLLDTVTKLEHSKKADHMRQAVNALKQPFVPKKDRDGRDGQDRD